jgi:ABC-type uncharacterized transport system involved in gliding motility auxiliary subunit
MQKKSIETILYSVGGVIAMAVVIVVLNFIMAPVRQRVDLTKEKAYTLAPGTKAILAKLDTPIKIRFYCTRGNVASRYAVPLQSYAKDVEDLLAEYKQAAKGKLIIEKYDPQPESDAEDSARLDEVEPQGLPGGERFYLGLTVSMLDSKQTIPFLAPDRERLLEYDISRAITRVLTPEKPVVGVMSSMPVFGMQSNPMMAQMGQRGQPAWALVTELQNDFNVKRVELTADKIDDDVKVLIVLHPKDISDAAQYAIDQFVLRGGKLIACVDANCLIDNRNAQNPMMAQMGGGGSSLDKLFKAWGITFESSKVVADMNFKMELGGGDGGQGQQRPTWLALTSEGIDTNDIVTSQIDNIWYFAGGAFSGTPATGLKETVLLKSTKESQLVDGMMANISPDSALKDFKASGTEYPLAIRLDGKFKTAFPEGKPAEKKDAEEKKESEKPEAKKPEEKKPDNSLKESKEDTAVILVGDVDMFHDNFTIQETQTPFGNMRRQLNANINFAQNAVEQMAGDKNLIGVRSRATLSRPFEVVKKMESEARKRYQGEIANLEKKAQEAQQRLSELQAQRTDKNQRFILSPEQQAELGNLEKVSAETNKKLRQVQKDLAQEVDSLKTRLTWVNIAVVPMAVALCGILLAVYKRKLTAAK